MLAAEIDSQVIDSAGNTFQRDCALEHERDGWFGCVPSTGRRAKQRRQKDDDRPLSCAHETHSNIRQLRAPHAASLSRASRAISTAAWSAIGITELTLISHSTQVSSPVAALMSDPRPVSVSYAFR
jgi:hypothetical protein